MDPVLLDSWEQFKAEIDKLRPVRGKFLFRGLEDENYKLETTFMRTFRETPQESRGGIRKRLIEYFCKECEHYPQYKDLIKDEFQCQALAQHHGLPTQLLDWTESPYIAAYFAFQAHLIKNPERTKKVAIWILDRRATGCWSEDRNSPEDERVRLISPASWHNERMQRQSGWFTVAKASSGSLDDYIVQMGNCQNALKKLVLPAIDAERALNDLDLMGINARELFVDLAAAARNAYVRTVLDYGNFVTNIPV